MLHLSTIFGAYLICNEAIKEYKLSERIKLLSQLLLFGRIVDSSISQSLKRSAFYFQSLIFVKEAWLHVSNDLRKMTLQAE